ncbi:hypothetical protein LCGC14_0396920 [marine sediment metagenome]|uniref:Uncharacterized protein n=1 Tax=marine sediment metagenome TaxID=412755 RepID=A0A0F9T3E1_9ZZZZ
MMDPQQIREALEWSSDARSERERYVQFAAKEYADLLETSERVWWCGEYGARAIDKDPHGWCLGFSAHSRHRKTYGCGWRLLTPIEGTS